MDYQQIIKTILAWFMTNIVDEENLAVNLQQDCNECSETFRVRLCMRNLCEGLHRQTGSTD